MKINLDAIVLDVFDNEVIKDGEVQTMKNFVVESIVMPLKSDEGEKAEKKLDRWELAKKCKSGGIVDFNVDELSIIKNRINDSYQNPIILGRFNDLIEGK